ncbi:MAG: PD-(D/E)XK nuclease family protein [Anaerolineae bacterium]
MSHPSSLILHPFTLSRARLESFIACPRQFQLRYLERRPWPRRPLQANEEGMLAKGQLFHQLLQRHFAGVDTAVSAIEDADVRRWWRLFQQHGPILPGGDSARLLPEMSLTVPLPGTDGRIHLTGRFDLLMVSRDSAHIFDWKTGRPRPTRDLRHDWHTRLYLALLAEGGQALGQTFAPDQIAITYWFANDHETPHSIQYDAGWHAQNWADIQALAAQIETRAASGDWPLTDDLAHCGRCPYPVICGRTAAPARTNGAEEWEPAAPVDLLEPELPQ